MLDHALKLRILVIATFWSEKALYRASSEDLSDRLEKRGHRIVRTSFYHGRLARLIDTVWTVIRRRRDYNVAYVDVFTGMSFWLAEIAGWALHCVGKPYVLVLRGGNLPAFARSHPRRVRALFRSASVVVAPSRYLIEQMRDYRDDVRMISNAIALERYPFRMRCPPRPRLIWLRAFRNIYNPALAVQVTALLAKDFDDVSLVFSGPDSKDGSLEHARLTAQENRIAERVAFQDGVEKLQVPIRLQEGDIFLNTTDIDNTPVTVIEAMACGLCVVSTNVGGVPYLLESGQDSLLVPPHDPEAMAAAVHRLMTEPGLAERLSANARRKIEQFDWPVVVSQWENLFESMRSQTNHVES
jgi:glycosyltransferase involved in cell wall biosynthesis